MDLRIVVAGEADEAAEAFLFGFFEGFDGTSGSEDFFYLIAFADEVGLPEIDVIGFEALAAEFEFAHETRFVALGAQLLERPQRRSL